MKHRFIGVTVVCCILAICSTSFSQDYYYCGDTTYTVVESSSKVTVQLDSNVAQLDIASFVGDHPC